MPEDPLLRLLSSPTDPTVPHTMLHPRTELGVKIVSQWQASSSLPITFACHELMPAVHHPEDPFEPHSTLRKKKEETPEAMR